MVLQGDSAGKTGSTVMLCPQCNLETLAGRHCKLICYACGYVESCEDNFVIDAPLPDVRRSVKAGC